MPDYLEIIMKYAIARFVSLALFVSFSVASFQATAGQQPFPIGPNSTMTPGSLCSQPDAYRYPEHIAYCNRNVDTQTKRAIIAAYDRNFGYKIQQMNRGDFKIDHYIPLCAGGSNNVNNLWPQHRSVYEITDVLEATVCEKMAQGRLSQADAITYIRYGKANLSQVDELMRRLSAL